MLTTSGTYPWSFVAENGQPSHGGDRKTFLLQLFHLRTTIFHFKFSFVILYTSGIYILITLKYQESVMASLMIRQHFKVTGECNG